MKKQVLINIVIEEMPMDDLEIVLEALDELFKVYENKRINTNVRDVSPYLVRPRTPEIE